MNELKANQLIEEAQKYLGREIDVFVDEQQHIKCIFKNIRTIFVGAGKVKILDVWAILRQVSNNQKQYEISLQSAVDAFKETDYQNS